MTAVAVRLVGRLPTAAERGSVYAIDGLAGAGHDSTGPATRKGPLAVGVMLTGPLRVASAALSFTATSPLAANPAVAWLPSQNGLLFEAPHRQSVARVAGACRRFAIRHETPAVRFRGCAPG